jgi:UDP-2,4-diacetamido-2,4,6-trideoxy-beta-L-altropyranose hydrolase
MALRVAFRADVSASIGTGHLRRCRSLADALTELGAEVAFVACPGDAPFLTGFGGAVFWLKTGDGDADNDARETAGALKDFAPDWVVVDHYHLDADWHKAVRAATGARVLVVDDLADRPLAPDLLVDHNIDADVSQKYAGRVEASVRCLLGPRFALLQPSYARATRCTPTQSARSIGIFMGGSDPRNACSLALRACREGAGFEGDIAVVSSRLSPHFDALSALCSHWPRTLLLSDLPDLRAFFAHHDLQVGAGGGAALERCCIGAPTVAVAVASNQLASLPSLEARGAIVWARADVPPESVQDFLQDDTLEARLGAAVRQLLGDSVARKALSERSRALVDGRGAHRVAAVMDLVAGGFLVPRAAIADDEALLLGWANDPTTRVNAFQPRPVTQQDHHMWFQSRLADPEGCRLFIVEAKNAVPVAQVRLDRQPDGWLISYSVDAALRGWGIGRKALEAVLQPLRTQQPHACFTARVMLHNHASVRIFEQLGFSQESVVDQRGAHLMFRLTPQR